MKEDMDGLERRCVKHGVCVFVFVCVYVVLCVCVCMCVTHLAGNKILCSVFVNSANVSSVRTSSDIGVFQSKTAQ
jgi:hypothetical protein